MGIGYELELISTHAPLAGRDDRTAEAGRQVVISTHAPLAGRDWPRYYAAMVSYQFQPTRPLRGATRQQGLKRVRGINISTHAPLAGRDPTLRTNALTTLISTHAPLAGRDLLAAGHNLCNVPDFNPRAPCGARRMQIIVMTRWSTFQPTRPLRGATAKVYKSLCTFLR